MAYELRMGGTTLGTWPELEQAEARAREIIRGDADAEPEIIDTETGRAAQPGGSRSWREHLANKVGF